MDYAYFEGLSSAEAQRGLVDFLREVTLSPAWVARLADEGVASVPSYFAEAAGRITVVQADPPAGEANFIVEAMEQHHGGFLDFAGEADRRELLLAAFYLGEAFVGEFSKLKWSVGREGRAEVRQPVVTGFRTDVDLPVLVVAENLLLRHEEQRADASVRTWAAVV